MTSGPGETQRAYRGRISLHWATAVLLWIVIAVCSYAEVLGVESVWLRVLLGMLSTASLSWMLLFIQRAGTFVRADGIAVRGALAVRKWAWRDIRDLRIEAIADARGSAPRHTAFLYDAVGRRSALIHVNDRTLTNLHAEVEALRTLVAGHGGLR
ncbi:hypothetical protein [Streptomyces sp. NPDC058755]|uniref:hypothetical protein n=1 Tax=Streptomyces sp. NPDC058755 TaxID=3346624 RepID=UPI0036A86C9C